MIIKDDKLAQAEAEPLTETPPPYSLAPEVRISLSSDTPPGQNSRALPPPSAPAPAQLSTPSSLVASGSTRNPVRPDGVPVSPPGFPRTSYMHVRRANAVLAGHFIVDPYLPFPPDVGLNAAEGDDDDFREWLGAEEGQATDGRRTNLRLECKNGNIDAEVWVVGANDGEGEGGGAPKRKKAMIAMCARNGYIAVKINASSASPAFSLCAGSYNGGVRVYLPRSFIGPLTTRTRNGWSNLSPSLSANTTNFSEICGTRKGFVGDFANSGYGMGEWHGSSLDISCENGRIKLYYLDETEEKVNGGKGSGRLLERLFNPAF